MKTTTSSYISSSPLITLSNSPTLDQQHSTPSSFITFSTPFPSITASKTLALSPTPDASHYLRVSTDEYTLAIVLGHNDIELQIPMPLDVMKQTWAQLYANGWTPTHAPSTSRLRSTPAPPKFSLSPEFGTKSKVDESSSDLTSAGAPWPWLSPQTMTTSLASGGLRSSSSPRLSPPSSRFLDYTSTVGLNSSSTDDITTRMVEGTTTSFEVSPLFKDPRAADEDSSFNRQAPSAPDVSSSTPPGYWFNNGFSPSSTPPPNSLRSFQMLTWPSVAKSELIKPLSLFSPRATASSSDPQQLSASSSMFNTNSDSSPATPISSLFASSSSPGDSDILDLLSFFHPVASDTWPGKWTPISTTSIHSFSRTTSQSGPTCGNVITTKPTSDANWDPDCLVIATTVLNGRDGEVITMPVTAGFGCWKPIPMPMTPVYDPTRGVWGPGCPVIVTTTVNGRNGELITVPVTAGSGCWRPIAAPTTTTGVGPTPSLTSTLMPTSGASRNALNTTDRSVTYVGWLTVMLMGLSSGWQFWRMLNSEIKWERWFGPVLMRAAEALGLDGWNR